MSLLCKTPHRSHGSAFALANLRSAVVSLNDIMSSAGPQAEPFTVNIPLPIFGAPYRINGMFSIKLYGSGAELFYR